MLLGFPVWRRTWQVRVGGVMLYLLDSDDAANLPVQLYGGGTQLLTFHQQYAG